MLNAYATHERWIATHSEYLRVIPMTQTMIVQISKDRHVNLTGRLNTQHSNTQYTKNYWRDSEYLTVLVRNPSFGLYY